MADATLPLNPGSGGLVEDVESLVGAGGVNVIRQRLQLAGSALAEIARILNVSPSGNEYGLVTRNIPSLNQVGAFGRFRTSTPQTLFDSKQIVDNQPLFWDDQQTSGAGTSSTFNANQASSTLAVSASTAGTRVRQTFRRFNYQPGKSQLVMLTGILGAPKAGITGRIGIFDGSNGLFFESSPTTVRVVRRTFTSGAAVDNAINQANWNLDPMDGTGPSGVTINPALTQIFVIDFEWLGTGSIRFGFIINGQIVYCHKMTNSNVLSLVYMSTPNLPLRYEIANDGTGAAASILHICAMVASEAGHQETGLSRATHRTTSLTTLNDANLYPLIAIQLGTIGADVRVLFHSIVCSSSAAAFAWAILLNPTVAGPALSFSAVTNSPVQVDISRTSATTVSGGTEIDSGIGSSTAQSKNVSTPGSPSELQLGSTIAGVSDILVLAVRRLTGTTETFWASLQWRESF